MYCKGRALNLNSPLNSKAKKMQLRAPPVQEQKKKFCAVDQDRILAEGQGLGFGYLSDAQ